MLSPKRTKYRKYHRGHMRGKATRGNEICFGKFGLQALEPNWITSRQIEAARRTITRYKNVVQNYGFEFFQIKRLRLEQQNQEWDLVKGPLITG